MKIKIRKRIKSKIKSRIKIGQGFPALNLHLALNLLPNLNLHPNLFLSCFPMLGDFRTEVLLGAVFSLPIFVV